MSTVQTSQLYETNVSPIAAATITRVMYDDFLPNTEYEICPPSSCPIGNRLSAVASSPNGLHPDPHALVFVPGTSGQTFFSGSDGGIVRGAGPFVDDSAKCATRGLSADETVRCQRLLKGEDGLLLAWVGDGQPMACATSGSPVDLPEPTDRRDGSGVPAAQPILAVSGPAGLLAI